MRPPGRNRRLSEEVVVVAAVAAAVAAVIRVAVDRTVGRTSTVEVRWGWRTGRRTDARTAEVR